jgi:copper(I)-binding protein
MAVLPMPIPLRAGLIAAASIAALAGCGGSTSSSELAISGAWSRPTPATADEAVVYLAITSDVDDAVVGASVPATVADAVELHATTSGGGGGAHAHGGGASGDDDLVSMGEVEAFDLGPSTPLSFAPGGNHLMLVGLAEPLRTGQEFELEVELASGRSVATVVPVQVNPPDE